MARRRPPTPTDELLDALPPALAALARRGGVERWRKDATILLEGTHGDALYILLEGSVKVCSTDFEGREIIYGVIEAGDYFGEMSLDGGPRSASIVAQQNCRCAVVTRATIDQHLQEHPGFAMELITKLIQRARSATATARAIALLDVYRRVKRCLEDLAEPQPDGSWSVRGRLTQQDIASRIGSSREMVSRLMKDLERGGYIETRARRLHVLRKLPARW